MRTVSSATQTEAAKGVTQPCYLVQIEWIGATSYLCTHSTQAWAGNTWLGGGLSVDQFDDVGRPRRITLVDPDAAFRTLILVSGSRDRRITIWKAYVGALAAADPVSLGVCYGDGAEVSAGRVTINLGPIVSSRVFSPRERIGPSIGVNFVAAPGAIVRWNGQQIVMAPR